LFTHVYIQVHRYYSKSIKKVNSTILDSGICAFLTRDLSCGG